MEEKIRITTDPNALAERALEILAEHGYAQIGEPPNPWSSEEARRLFRERLGDERSTQYVARSAWAAAQGRKPPNALLTALSEFAYARAIDALIGDPDKLSAWLNNEEGGSPALAREAGRLAPEARDIAEAAHGLAKLLPRASDVEMHLTQAIARAHVHSDQVELSRAAACWTAARRVAIRAQRLAVDLLLDGSGLPRERRALTPAPLWPMRGERHQDNASAIVYEDFVRLNEAGVSLADLTFVGFGKFTPDLQKRLRTQLGRTRGQSGHK